MGQRAIVASVTVASVTVAVGRMKTAAGQHGSEVHLLHVGNHAVGDTIVALQHQPLTVFLNQIVQVTVQVQVGRELGIQPAQQLHRIIDGQQLAGRLGKQFEPEVPLLDGNAGRMLTGQLHSLSGQFALLAYVAD
jgi:hypothetical protein